MSDRAMRAIRPEIRAMQVYHVATPKHRVKLNQNEFPIDVPESVKSQVASSLVKRDWARYPQIDSQDLRDGIRREFSLPESADLLVGNGSNDLIRGLFSATIGTGSRLVLPVPTFALYKKLVTIAGGEAVEVSLNEDFTYDVDRILQAARDEDAKLIVLVRPNNPTGNALPLSDIRRIAAEAPGLLVVDEAYAEFARDSALPLLTELENLVVLRTFSKAWHAAGLRIGYLAGTRSIVREIAKTILPFNTSVFVEDATLTLMKNRELLQPAVTHLCDERDRMIAAMHRIDGVTPFPSEANFICFRTPHASDSLYDALLQHGFLVRNIGAPGLLSRCLRVSVGTDEQNRGFLAALEEVMKTT